SLSPDQWRLLDIVTAAFFGIVLPFTPLGDSMAASGQQLCLDKPPPPSSFDDDAKELTQADQETAGKVVSQVGIHESMASILKDLERFRPKRAAVLICIFEGDDGDYVLIFAKRSSRLCTHSGLCLLLVLVLFEVELDSEIIYAHSHKIRRDGEVSVPGGKAEEDDGMTATRESEEEIGLEHSLVDVVTSLKPYETWS
ncbi:unnamed protein product, partial [Thlaspi arvense]